MKRRKSVIWRSLIYLFLPSLIIFGCQGMPSEKPPIHINPNMDDQPKYQAQEESKFFANGSAMRVPPAGTVARGELHDDTEFYYGKTKDGSFVKKIPLTVNMDFMKRGQERFNIYCSPCHSRLGNGKGIVPKRGFLPPPTFHQDKIRQYPDGQIFDVITHGIRNMPAYRKQIPVKDRWAIVAYVRALQKSQEATAEDVPPEILKDLK